MDIWINEVMDGRIDYVEWMAVINRYKYWNSIDQN